MTYTEAGRPRVGLVSYNTSYTSISGGSSFRRAPLSLQLLLKTCLKKSQMESMQVARICALGLC